MRQRLWLLLALCIACGKKPTTTQRAPEDAGFAVLVPMAIEEAGAPAPTLAPPTPPPSIMHDYKDAFDLKDEPDAGCAPGNKVVSVGVDVVKSGQGVDLVIAALGVHKRISWSEPDSFTHCTATQSETDTRFSCVTDEGSIGGKVYVLGNTVIVSTKDNELTHSSFRLPCGSKVRFEKPSCPQLKNCETRGRECSCLPKGIPIVPPAPSPT